MTTTKTTSRLKRVLQFPLTRIVIGFLWIVLSVSVSSLLAQTLHDSLEVIAAVVPAMGALLGYYTFVRVVERRRPTEIVGSGVALELLAGLSIGALLIASTMGVLYLVGVYQVNGSNEWTVMLPPLKAALMAGVVEELLIRGLVFRIVEEWIGSTWALLFSAVLFGALHVVNPNTTVLSVVAIALEAGVMLAAAYMLTRRLWLAIGVHIAWNFVQGGVFGVATSGVATKGLLISSMTGAPWLSGGEFGAEGSIVAVLICLSAGAVMLWASYRRGRFMPRRSIRAANEEQQSQASDQSGTDQTLSTNSTPA